MRWLVQQVGERGATEMAGLLGYDEANLGKVIEGKRRLLGKLRKLISDQMMGKGIGSA
jgi:hypothetical protein